MVLGTVWDIAVAMQAIEASEQAVAVSAWTVVSFTSDGAASARNVQVLCVLLYSLCELLRPMCGALQPLCVMRRRRVGCRELYVGCCILCLGCCSLHV